MFSPEINLSRSSAFGVKTFFEAINKIGKPKRVKKGETIIRQGTPPTFIIYIQKGAFKTVVKTPRKNYILAFTFADDIDCCPAALLNNQPNNFSIEAIADSEVLVCDFEALKKYLGSEGYTQWAIGLLLHYASFLEAQLTESLSLTAEERYKKLLETQPEKMKLVPLSLVASYLGITIERLSRIRQKLRV